MAVDVLVSLTTTAVVTTATAPTAGKITPYSASAGALTPALPALSSVPTGRTVGVQKHELDVSSNFVTFTCAGSDTFDSGLTSITLRVAGSIRLLQAVLVGGVKKWKVVGGHDPLTSLDGRFAAAAVAMANRPQSLLVKGDSIAWGRTASEFGWADLVADYLGCSLLNQAVPGEVPANIALRGGDIAATFSVPGGTIPASAASRVAVTLQSGEANFLAGSAGSPNIGNYVGRFRGIDVSLRQRTEDSGWTIARLVDGAAVTVPAGNWPFYSTASRGHRDDITVYWGGYNNTTAVASWAQKMVDNLTGSPKRFLVLGILTGASETSGSGGYTLITNANTSLATAFPSNYFDMRRHLIDNGLALAGITPTTQDTADIAADTVPTSLRADDRHPNAACNRVIARKVAELIYAKGWSPTITLPPAEPGATAPITQGLVLNSSTARAARTTPPALRSATKFSVRVIFQASAFASGVFFGRRSVANGDAATAWQMQFNNAGFDALFQAAAGANFAAGSRTYYQTFGGSSAILPTGQVVGYRIDYDSVAGTCAFYTSTDAGATWTLARTATDGAVALFDVDTPFVLSGQPITGVIKKIDIIDGSTTYVSRNFTVANATEDAAWTLSGGAAIS